MRLPPRLCTAIALAGCPGASAPHPGNAPSRTIEIGEPGYVLRGVAGDAAQLYAARASLDGTRSTIEARRDSGVAWTRELAEAAGPIAVVGDVVIVSVSVRGDWVTPESAKMELHGQPSAGIAALDARTGAPRWHASFDASEWAVITSLAAAPNGGVIVGGTFGGTLREITANGGSVVSSAGKSDGFVASLDAKGYSRWLVRIGGQGADSVQGVAARGDRVAVAGTFTAGADVLGQLLVPYDERLPFADGFVAELDAAIGTRVWATSFGSKADDSVAGVAIVASGGVAVAATAREPIRIGGEDHPVRGAGDGIVAWFAPTGDAAAVAVIGGTAFDGLRAIAAVDDRVVVAGFFAGTLALGSESFTSDGGDDAFLATVAPNGGVQAAWYIGGPGREEVTALSSVPGGFVAGVAHSARAIVGGERAAEPKDPASGAILVERPAP